MIIYITESQFERIIVESVTKREVQSFLTDFGFFLYMNLVKVKTMSNDHNDANEELTNLVKTFNKPLINGKNFVELSTDNELYKNPKLLSALFKQVKNLIEYIEPRIERFVKESETKTIWLNKIDKFKTEYKKIVS